jgi:hypothetical protein
MSALCTVILMETWTNHAPNPQYALPPPGIVVRNLTARRPIFYWLLGTLARKSVFFMVFR